ncbi:MAG: lamin tail domain-containing protein, partial [Roseibacillus sp.]|nr:lamin tail domain-containing protein [Roseibacillus sp.]
MKLPLCAVAGVILTGTLPLGAEFTAFNDIVAGPATHANATTYAPNATASGPMKDIASGANTAVTLTVTASGVSYEDMTGVPAAATDAGATLLGFIDFSTAHPHSLALSGGDHCTYTFFGLNSSSQYEFVGTAVRGQSTYTNRWTLVTINGADSFTAAHSTGVGIITSSLAPNQVAVWTGDNSQADQGFIAQWTDIDPGADGTFSIVSNQYTGSTGGVGSGTANGSKGYGINGIRLKESFYTPPSIVINEVHYDEDDKTVRAEFIEIYNLSNEPVRLTGWELTGAVDYTFPRGAALGVGAFLVIAEDPPTMQSQFGYANALGPWTGKLRNSGETINLRDQSGAVVSRVDYRLGFPWPTVGDPVGSPAKSPSIQLINPLLETDLGGSWRSGPPTPGRQNSVYDVDAPPQTRQVSHIPKQPASGEPVVVSALVTDPDGVSSVFLSYQVVRPGGYFCRYLKFNSNGTPNYDSRYENPGSWTPVPMADDGLEDDLLADDGVFTVTLPTSLQRNRFLIRYRITVSDTAGNSVPVPYEDDPQPNFAYFVYDGTPDWTGVIRSGDTAVTYPGDQMSSIPTYFLLSTSAWVDDSQFGGYGGSEYLWPGTMIYDGEVYDHIQYRPRGNGRFQYGKNFWKFDFHRGRRFQAKDEYGNEYKTTWDKLNFSSIVQQVSFEHRGEQGLFEGVGFRLFELCAVEACKTHHVQFYVIDNASPTGANQYEGDYYGLFLVIEQMDGQFLDEHNLPDGNLYKIEGHNGDSNNQGASQVTNRSDVSAFISASRSGNPTAQWWRDNLDIENYLSYRTIVEGIHHYDIAYGKNYFYYNNPETGLFEVHPWDLDLTFANNMFGNGDHDFRSKVAMNPAFNTDYQNRVREIIDLLFNRDEGYRLVDETVKFVYTPGQRSLVGADRRLWDNHPRLIHKDRYYDIANTKDFEGMVRIVKSYIATRGLWMANTLLTNESQVPAKPVLNYTGAPDFPTDELTFSCSDYSSPSGSAFAAMEWRVGEVHNPSVPNYDPTQPNIYEIEDVFESGELTTFNSEYRFPTIATRVDRTYRARVRFKDAAGRWGHWSNPIQFTTTTPDIEAHLRDLRISEIMYHPPEPVGSETTISTNRDEFEYVELKNVGAAPLDLRDIRFTKGIDFDFAGSLVETLEPGAFVLVVKNFAAFETRYGNDLPVAGEYPNDNLRNSGERLKLSFGAGVPIHDIDEYSDT